MMVVRLKKFGGIRVIYKQFRGIGLSRLGLGNMRLPTQEDKAGAPIDYPRAKAIVDYAIAHGINYFDTAYNYHSGTSEVFLGQALQDYDRGSYHLATKFNYHANPDYRAQFEEQLTRLKTDYVDFYLLHAVGDGNVENYLGCGCIDYFREQKAKGRIRSFGFSSHASPEVLSRMLGENDWDFVQIQLNYYDWFYGTAKEEYSRITAKGLPVMVMESVRGGRLAKLSPESAAMLKAEHPDWSIPSWAFRWLKRLEGVQVALSGMSNLEQIQDNVATYADERALTDEEEALLFKACAAYRSEVTVPCTACRYCCDGCPAGIDIPAVLEIYNRFKIDGAWALKSMETLESAGKPADCVGCGACKSECPQGIDIPQVMAELASQPSK